jgi:catechol 2,3-dioxygenase-like lactoylglutathione lyase family enzyme
MPLHKIDHVTINATDLDRTCAFYGDALGFGVKKMEGRGYTGAWLLLSGHPFVHVVVRRAQQAPDTTGIIDHFALEATDIAGTRAHLSKVGVAFRENALPEFELHQIVVRDPDGVKVELNFRGQSA